MITKTTASRPKSGTNKTKTVALSKSKSGFLALRKIDNNCKKTCEEGDYTLGLSSLRAREEGHFTWSAHVHFTLLVLIDFCPV